MQNVVFPVKTPDKNILVLSYVFTIIICISGGVSHNRALASTRLTRDDHLDERIDTAVRELDYPSAVARDFVDMVGNWKDERDKPILVVLDERLAKARLAGGSGALSAVQLAKIEEGIIATLGRIIWKEVGYEDDYFDLADIIEDRTANCLGYSQILYVLGKSIGLSAYVARIMPEHAANVLFLADGTMTIIDLTRAGESMAESMMAGSKLDGRSGYWKLESDSYPTGDDNTIHILSRNELVGEIHFCRGTIEYASGQNASAILHYNMAIKFDPKCAKAYNNRGAAHLLLHAHSKAIPDFNHAIELEPDFPSPWQNRGNAYLDLSLYTKAIVDYSRTIELDPDFGKAHLGRGHAYRHLEDYARAVSDYTRAIGLMPNSAGVYYMRGICNAHLGENEKARKDMLRAVELDGKLRPDVEDMAAKLKLNLELN